MSVFPSRSSLYIYIYQIKWSFGEKVIRQSARKLLQSHVHHVCDGLRICRRARSTAVDAIVDISQLICNAVGLGSSFSEGASPLGFGRVCGEYT